jgi:RNA polymerase sigma factor (sigma-70 family)
MGYRSRLCLLDDEGRPFNSRIERALSDLRPRLQRQFPALRDEIAVTEVLEEAGRRITDHEARSGPIGKLHGYAWVTVRSVAMSRMRRSAARLASATLETQQGRAVLSIVPSTLGSAQRIEDAILFQEVLAHLTPDERLVFLWKKAGFSSGDIAKHWGVSAGAIDTLLCRARQKIRRVLGVQEPARRAQNG